MRKVTIVTDTTACIPQEQVERYDIEIVPVQLVFEDRTYHNGIDISPTEFYARLRQSKKLPTTSSASPDSYLEAYRRASQKTQSILCVTLTASFSGIFNSAKLAMEMAKSALPKVDIKVLDSGTAAAAQGLIVLAAARAAASGKNLDEVIETAQSVMSRVSLFATLDTLEYLARSGRVPQAAALVNSLLKIKPVFTLNHNGASTVALPRTIPGAIKHMLKLMDRRTTRGQPLHVAVMHADALDKAIALRNQIASQFNCTELFITEFTPVMGVHTGPGLLGIAFYSGN